MPFVVFLCHECRFHAKNLHRRWYQLYDDTTVVVIINYDRLLISHHSLQVPVTQRPYTVHVPQNVPVNFVPVSVPRQDLPAIQVLEQDPFTYCESILNSQRD